MKQIELTQGHFALVDDEDFERLIQFKWHVNKNRNVVYAERKDKRGIFRVTVKMHREILNAPKGYCVDHIDGDGLNNTRSNLRLCTNSENIRNSNVGKRNTSGYKGVSWHARDKRWQAKIVMDGKQNHIGNFDTAEEAALAYNEAAKMHYGDFARLNVIKNNCAEADNA